MKLLQKTLIPVEKSSRARSFITNHSFRIGYISQLWKDTKDIEFVRQTIGHRSLNATSSYVSEMGEKERQDRISRINTFITDFIIHNNMIILIKKSIFN